MHQLRVEDLLSRLENPKRVGDGRWVAPCPAHGDHDSSLSIREGESGRTLLHCFAGCEYGEILAALALAPGQLSPDRSIVRPARPRPPEKPAAPPRDEVNAFWCAAQSVTSDPKAVRYWAGRRIDPAVVEDRDLFRVVPIGHPLPAWAARFGTGEADFRCLFPLYDARGDLVSVRARPPVKKRTGEAKCHAPYGFTSRGMVLADPLARGMLAGDKTALELIRRGAPVWISEGEPDWLFVSTRYGDSDDSPAVIGIFNGAWCQDIADRVPDKAKMIIATHEDPAGEKYAAEIASTFSSRPAVTVVRWRAPRRENHNAV